MCVKGGKRLYIVGVGSTTTVCQGLHPSAQSCFTSTNPKGVPGELHMNFQDLV